MVHLRLNEREANPNPRINFITALPCRRVVPSEEEAQELLRALAAQVRPVMKSHGFTVNSFEEYEHNRVFAGRNWNNGETVEIVLRRPNGSFAPISFLMNTLCHELAHISHMNHGPAFQKLWARLRKEVKALQEKGYYGDGYWSSGNRLADSAKIVTEPLADGDLPEYVCGGAQSRVRPRSGPRRRKEPGPSLHTGAQTEKRRRPGGRVIVKDKFVGEGQALDDEGRSASGAGFGKQANSKRAREERAAAAERRIKALQASTSTAPVARKSEEHASDSDGLDDDGPRAIETDHERRRAMLDATQEDDLELDTLKTNRVDLRDYFAPITPKSKSWPETTRKASSPLFFDVSDDDEAFGACDLPSGSTSMAVAGSRLEFQSGKSHRKRRGSSLFLVGSDDEQDEISTTSKPPSLSDGKRRRSSSLFLEGSDNEEVPTTASKNTGLPNGKRRRSSSLFLEGSDDEEDDILLSTIKPHPSSPITIESHMSSSSETKGKMKASTDLPTPPSKKRRPNDISHSPLISNPARQKGSHGMLQDEIQSRKREALGMEEGRQYKLGGAAASVGRGGGTVKDPLVLDLDSEPDLEELPDSLARPSADMGEWACLVCTFQNAPLHLACSVCATPKGERVYSGR